MACAGLVRGGCETGAGQVCWAGRVRGGIGAGVRRVDGAGRGGAGVDECWASAELVQGKGGAGWARAGRSCGMYRNIWTSSPVLSQVRAFVVVVFASLCQHLPFEASLFSSSAAFVKKTSDIDGVCGEMRRAAILAELYTTRMRRLASFFLRDQIVK